MKQLRYVPETEQLALAEPRPATTCGNNRVFFGT